MLCKWNASIRSFIENVGKMKNYRSEQQHQQSWNTIRIEKLLQWLFVIQKKKELLIGSYLELKMGFCAIWVLGALLQLELMWPKETTIEKQKRQIHLSRPIFLFFATSSHKRKCTNIKPITSGNGKTVGQKSNRFEMHQQYKSMHALWTLSTINS